MIDIGNLLDDGVWSVTQRIVVLVSALSIILDGFDGQLIGYAIPVLIKEWGVTKAAFAPVVAMGLIGMALGSVIAGYVADRFGRRFAVLASVLTFGVATLLIGFSPDITTLAILRFCAGLGVGGALPVSTTMSGEFTPLRYRTMAVTATIVCVPLGGMLAGLFASEILPAFGWRVLFFAGGAIPIVLFVILLTLLPESPRWLSRHPSRWPALVALLNRMSRAVPADAGFKDVAEQKTEHGSKLSALFTDGRGLSTVAIATAFFLTTFTVYMAFSWLPTMLTTVGLSVAVAGRGLTAYNLGGVFGALLCAMAINRFGSRWPIALCAIGAAVSAFLLRGMDFQTQTTAIIIGIGIHGLFVNAVQSTLYAVAGNLYPTLIRASGTAFGLAVGRIGAILSAFAGAAVIAAAGADGYLGLLAIAMIGTCGALLVLRQHIPARLRTLVPSA